MTTVESLHDAIWTGPEDKTAVRDRPLAWTATAIATAALFLLVFNAGALNAWVLTLEPSPLTAQLRAPAQAWVDQTDRLGLGRPHAAMHALWERQRASRWGAGG